MVVVLCTYVNVAAIQFNIQELRPSNVVWLVPRMLEWIGIRSVEFGGPDKDLELSVVILRPFPSSFMVVVVACHVASS